MIEKFFREVCKESNYDLARQMMEEYACISPLDTFDDLWDEGEEQGCIMIANLNEDISSELFEDACLEGDLFLASWLFKHVPCACLDVENGLKFAKTNDHEEFITHVNTLLLNIYTKKEKKKKRKQHGKIRSSS